MEQGELTGSRDHVKDVIEKCLSELQKMHIGKGLVLFFRLVFYHPLVPALTFMFRFAMVSRGFENDPPAQLRGQERALHIPLSDTAVDVVFVQSAVKVNEPLQTMFWMVPRT